MEEEKCGFPMCLSSETLFFPPEFTSNNKKKSFFIQILTLASGLSLKSVCFLFLSPDLLWFVFSELRRSGLDSKGCGGGAVRLRQRCSVFV